MKILINFYANVSEGTVNDLMHFVNLQIAQQKQESPIDEIILQISSSGGSSDHGLLAYNFLKQLSLPKTTIGMGNVDSAAVMLFAAGDKRLAMPSCRFLLHEARGTIHGEFSATKLEETSKIIKRITNDYRDVVSLVTNKTKQNIGGKIKKGTVLSSEEAITLGLVTTLQTEPYLKSMQNLAIMLIRNPQPLIHQSVPAHPNHQTGSIGL